MENGGYLRVHLDGQILFDRDSLVSSVDLPLHPVLEFAVQDCTAHVGDPSLWSLRKFNIWLGQVVVHFRVIFIQELSNFLHAQPFVLGNVDGPDHRSPEHFLLLVHYILHEIDTFKSTE